MDAIKVVSQSPVDHAIKICTEHYRLKNFEYETGAIEHENTVTVTIKSNKKVDSSIIIDTDESRLKGYITLFPAINGGHMMGMVDIMGYIESKGILSFDMEKIQEAVQGFVEKEIIYKVLFAEGIPPKEGKDAELIYHFDTNLKHRSIKDGKIDHKESVKLPLITKGAKIMTKKPPVQGSKGLTIFGEDIKPRTVKDRTIILSDGATVNETGSVFIASVNGYVDFNGVKLGVYPVYIVDKNVDYSTGNIKFNGSVYVKGDVLSGFKIEASKNVMVDGVCQDCEIVAKGDIILQSGIKCKKSGMLKAGGNILLGYAENTTIYTKGSLDIRKYLFNCNVFCGLSVIATQGEGIVAGGNINAFQEVSCKQLGTTGNSKFTINLGSKFYFIAEIERLEKEKNRILDTLDKIEVVLARFDNSEVVFGENVKLNKMIELKDSLTSLVDELNTKEKTLKDDNRAKNPKVKVKNKVFDGVTVKIHEGYETVKETKEGVVAVFDEKYNGIIWVSLKTAESLD